ncbi:MAG: hypothetical protein ACHQ6T_15515 [Myxococcota bacterium]
MRSLGVSVAVLGLAFLSCAQNAHFLPSSTLDFFVESPREDPWNAKIKNWQSRNQLDQLAIAERRPSGSQIGDDYQSFELKLRRRIAAETVAWIQEESRHHYIPDGEIDHWATLSEVIAQGGDDCDGLDLMTFLLLRKLGFSKDELFRSIVVDKDTGQHHMVTLWFEDSDRHDPWILDPTGVVTNELVHLSQVPRWNPIEMFDEARHYRVEESPGAGAVAQR